MDLRQVLTRYKIDWRDRGPNCSSQFVNIQCPWCGATDPSYHLRIHQDDFWYYCLRNGKHKGGSLHWLFTRLRIPTNLLPEKALSQPAEEPAPNIPHYDLTTLDPAESNLEALAYLASRSFSFPVETARKFGLRTAKNGKWAGRLVIPLTLGWTGRSMRSHIQPRYLATDYSGYFSYGRSTVGVLVEGPIDAMKVAGVTDHFRVFAITGGVAVSGLLNILHDAHLDLLYCVPDNDVSPLSRTTLMQGLRTALPTTRVELARLPADYKDAGEMSENEVRRWIYGLS